MDEEVEKGKGKGVMTSPMMSLEDITAVFKAWRKQTTIKTI